MYLAGEGRPMSRWRRPARRLWPRWPRDLIAALGKSPGVAGFALRGIRGQALAALSPAAGLLFALALAIGVLQFSEAAAARGLQVELRETRPGGLPASAILLVRTAGPDAAGTRGDPLQGPELLDLASHAIGAPPAATVRNAVSIPLPASGAFLGHLRVGFLDGIEANAVLEDGGWPGQGGARLEAAMLGSGMDALGLLTGDVVSLTLPSAAGRPIASIEVSLVGRWRPGDAASAFWYSDPQDQLGAALMVREADFRTYVGDARPDLIGTATWFSAFPAEAFQIASLDRQIDGLRRLGAPGVVAPEGISPGASPLSRLERARASLLDLNLLLLLVAAPLFAACGYYVAAAARLGAESRASEISTLRSRGAGSGHVFMALLSQALIVNSAAAAAAPFLGLLVAGLVDHSYGFLIFGPRAGLQSQIAPIHFAVAGAGALVGALASSTAAYASSSASSVVFRRAISRGSGKPLWQRLYLEFVLFAVAGYLFWRMARGADDSDLMDPAPLLAPLAVILGIALLMARILPALMAILGRLFGRSGLMPEELAAKHLARDIGAGAPAFVLVAATVGFGLFLASVGESLVRNEERRVRFELGADAFLLEGSPAGAPAHLGPGLAPVYDFSPAGDPPNFNLPVDLHEEVAGVAAAARLWRGYGLLQTSRLQEVRVYAIDPDEFPRAAWWRPEFAALPLSELMGRLGADRAALVSADLAADGLGPGATLSLRFGPDETGSGGPPFTPVTALVVGTFREFPTHQPARGPLIVLNARGLFPLIGERPWDVLIRTAPGWRIEEALEALRARQLPVISAIDVAGELDRRRSNPARVGLFGMLSAGFVGVLTLALALLAHQAILSYHRRRPQVGILRATGMSMWQMARWLAAEFCVLACLAVAGGLMAGALAAWFGLRFFEAAVGGSGLAPEFVATVAWGAAWQMALISALMVMLAVAAVIAGLARAHPHQAIQLAEEQY